MQSPEEIRALFDTVMARQPFIRLLGVRLVDAGAGHCTLGLTLRPDHMQHGGTAHGGVIGTLADNAAGAAASTTMPAGHAAVTVEYRISFLNPASGQELRAEGQVLRAGRSLVHTKADVFAIAGDGTPPRHVAALLATMAPFELPKH